MKDGNIDEYIAKFDTLVAQAGYEADDVQMLKKFISGLLTSLYETIYQLDNPKNYEDWRQAAIKQQEKWLHMQLIKQGRRTLESFKQTSGLRSNNLNRFLTPPPWDPNAMDTSAQTRVQGCLSLTDDRMTLQNTKKMRNHLLVCEKGTTVHNKNNMGET
jgi:hypothetical protein